MGNNLVQFRIDEKLKNQAKEICKSMGIDLQTYLRICTFRLVSDNGIPFDLRGGISGEKASLAMKEIQIQSERNGLSDMTLEEINEIIAEVRKERRERKAKEKQHKQAKSKAETATKSTPRKKESKPDIQGEING